MKKSADFGIKLTVRGSFGNASETKISLGESSVCETKSRDRSPGGPVKETSKKPLSDKQRVELESLLRKIQVPMVWPDKPVPLVFDSSTCDLVITTSNFRLTTGWYHESPLPVLNELTTLIQAIANSIRLNT
jgi:hypothetical protein